MRRLKEWWDKLNSFGLMYGYHPNPVKTYLVVKTEKKTSEAKELFGGTGVNICDTGRPYLGAPMGSDNYAGQFISRKVSNWISEVGRFASFAQSQPHAAFAALTHGLIRN